MLAEHGSSNLHTVFTSECNNKQFDWFSVGVYESFRASGMQGSITRLLACNKEDLKEYKGLDLGPTFVHPNYRHNPINGDTSASYNKPASVMHFSMEANFTEEFILFIDADMLLARPIDPVALGAKKGVVVSEYVPYMIGTGNGMAEQFLPAEAAARARPVGWYHIFHRDDLRRIAPLWLKYCGRVRMEPERYWSINGSIPSNIPTGDAYVKFGKAPWISEMYGYAFGSAEAGVEHVVTHGIVKYPGEVSNFGAEPYILHYGIDFTLSRDYNWNKMSYQKLDLFQCKGRYFGPPPAGKGTPRDKAMRFVVNTLNRAFCGFYHARCPHTPAAERRCPLLTRPADVPCVGGDRAPGCCRDTNPTCWQWALDEQCELNKGFMADTCKLSCGLCDAADDGAADAAGSADLTYHALAKLDQKLQAFAAAQGGAATGGSSPSPDSSPSPSPPPQLLAAPDTNGGGGGGGGGRIDVKEHHDGTSQVFGAGNVPAGGGSTSNTPAVGGGNSGSSSSSAAVAAAAAAAEARRAAAEAKANSSAAVDSYTAAKAAKAKAEAEAHEAAAARSAAAAREKAAEAARAAQAFASRGEEKAKAEAEVQAAADQAKAAAATAAAATAAAATAAAAVGAKKSALAASAADLTTQLGQQEKREVAPATSASTVAKSAPAHSLPRPVNTAYHDPIKRGLGKDHDAAAEIRDEFRRVAEAHASLYKPGHVPKWLQQHEKLVGGADMGHPGGTARAPSASAPLGKLRGYNVDGDGDGDDDGGAHSSSAGRLLPSDRVGGGSRDLAEAEEDRGHRWLLYWLLGLWGSLIGIAAARYFRVFPFNSGRKRRPRKDLMHRY